MTGYWWKKGTLTLTEIYKNKDIYIRVVIFKTRFF